MNGYVLKGECAMGTIPLTSYEQVKYGLDDQVQHPGVPALALAGQVSSASIVAKCSETMAG